MLEEDEILLAALLRPESFEMAFNILFKQLRNSNAVKYIMREVKDQDLLVNIFHDAFMKLINALVQGRFRGEASIETFFCVILQREKLAELKKKIGFELVEEMPEGIIFTQYPELNEAQKNVLRQVRANIGARCMEMLYLTHVDRISHKKIGALMEIEGETRAAASDCRRAFRLFFCQRTELLTEMGLDKARDYFERRKAILIEVANVLEEKQRKKLKLHEPCVLDNFHLARLLNGDNNATGPRQEREAAFRAFFEKRPDLLTKLNIRKTEKGFVPN